MAANASTSADSELLFTRILDAPRELVFKAWTDPRHLTHWWGPTGFTTTVHEMDLRPGGIWRLTMRGPDGRDYNNRIVFQEVLKPERLVYRHEPEEGSEPVRFETTVTFAAEGCQTRLTMRMLFPSEKSRDHVVEKYGAVEGGKQTLARLEAHLPSMVVKELITTRIFDAPRELVFQAWTERERLQRWWGPRGFTVPRCDVDARPGGAIRIDMRAPNGVVYPMIGTYLEIAAPERLVFTSSALDRNDEALFEVLNVVSFEAEGEKTKLTLRAIVTSATSQAAKHLDGMNQGWSETLDRLGEEVAR